jgi:hypothetical protein
MTRASKLSSNFLRRDSDTVDDQVHPIDKEDNRDLGRHKLAAARANDRGHREKLEQVLKKYTLTG